uniref:Transcription repressor n=1 Tax=Cajanus cajan TaxID=3821 RepID=A0A151RL97_CAJCA|nr:hypothetical protein KK1_035234 [Cajanus cajan]
MPSTRNLRYLNLNMCCSNSATPESESPPLSPITTSSNHNSQCPSPSSIMIKNFNSIYDPTLTSHHSFTSTFFSTTTLFEDDGDVEKMKKKKLLFKGSVAVATYSPDPYVDFRRSMQEMVEARPELMDVKSNWNILHELLLCYLALNPKSTHKFILGAFADLLVSLMSF